jgi:hypothetical protein
MPSNEIKLMRVTEDTECKDCNKKLPFGTFAHFHEETETAICVDCGVKRGWENKDVVKSIIKKLELQKDIKALAARRKVYSEALAMMKEKIDLHLLGEQDKELEDDIVKLMTKVKEYINNVASKKEKEALADLFKTIDDTKKTQKVIREIIRSRYFLMERDAEAEDELPEEENATEETSALKEIA